MARCKICDGYLIYEPEFIERPARYKCSACGWMVCDPNFRKEQPRYFPSDAVDRRREWQQENPGYNLYDPTSAAYQLNTSVSHLKYCIRTDSLLMEWGMIACNTLALQSWWDGKSHHRAKNA